MAKPQKIKNKNGSVSYRIFINRTLDGVTTRESKSFSTRQLAVDWADKRQREIDRAEVYGEVSSDLIQSVIERYKAQYHNAPMSSKNYTLTRLLTHDIAKIKVSKLTAKDIISHCIERNKTVKPQTAMHDVICLRTALRTMAATEGFDYDPAIFERAMTVMKQEKLVAKSKERTRRPTQAELMALSRHFYRRKSKIPMLHIMWFAIYSARRVAEITRLEWDDNNDDKQTGMVRDAKHPTAKKGNHRRFKYSRSAWKIITKQPKVSPFIFPYHSQTISELFRRACLLIGITDLHFHDLRHEATSRLFESGYPIEQVQLFTLHEDWKTLSRYTHLRPEDIS